MSRDNKNLVWRVGQKNADGSYTSESVNHSQLAVLMDIRDELQQLNRTLACPNFQAIPHHISRIARDTAGLRRDLKKPRKK